MEITIVGMTAIVLVTVFGLVAIMVIVFGNPKARGLRDALDSLERKSNAAYMHTITYQPETSYQQPSQLSYEDVETVRMLTQARQAQQQRALTVRR